MADEPPSHLDLLKRAQMLQGSAMRGDVDAVHAELCALRNSISQHLHSEQVVLAHLPSPADRVVTRGQHQLLHLVDRLLSDTTNEDSECACLTRAVELTLLLSRQARLEASLLRDPGCRGSDDATAQHKTVDDSPEHRSGHRGG